MYLFVCLFTAYSFSHLPKAMSLVTRGTGLGNVKA